MNCRYNYSVSRCDCCGNPACYAVIRNDDEAKVLVCPACFSEIAAGQVKQKEPGGGVETLEKLEVNHG